MIDADEDEKTEEEAFIPPSAYQQLEDPNRPGEPGWAPRRCQQMLNKGIVDGMPEFNQSLLRRWLSEAQQELEKLKASRVPAMPAGPANGNGLTPPPAPTAPAPDMAQIGIPGAPPPMAA